MKSLRRVRVATRRNPRVPSSSPRSNPFAERIPSTGDEDVRSLVKKTIFLSCSHFVVRSLGFLLRIWLSRELGAQAMGICELAQSAQMLLITPVVSGIPAAVTRMSAKESEGRRVRTLRCAAALSLAVSLMLALLAFRWREALCAWLGDMRTMPALLLYLPCIPILGVSCVLNGYAYGVGKPIAPAAGELLEQVVRAMLCVRLVYGLRGMPLTLVAAIPAAAALAGETAGFLLILTVSLRALLRRGEGARRPIFRELLALTLPLTGMRLVSALMQTVNASLIPARLRLFGFSAEQAMASLGIFHGMLKPVLMLPSFIVCSLSMAASPELTRMQAEGKPLAYLSGRMLAATLLVGCGAMAGVFIFAPLIANVFYKQAALLPLLRAACPLVPVMAMNHVCGSMMNALGLQKTSLKISLAASLTGVTAVYCLIPKIALWGAVVSLAAAQGLTLFFSLRALRRSGCIAR